MKKQKINYPKKRSRSGLYAFLFLLYSALSIGPANAQEIKTYINGEYVGYFPFDDTHKIRDIIVPTGYRYVYLVAKGADGGPGGANGGEGVRADGYVKVGPGPGEMPAGSVLRLIPGQAGGTKEHMGGGGGGSGILFQTLKDPANWTVLIIAGGGGGGGSSGNGQHGAVELEGMSGVGYDVVPNNGSIGQGGTHPDTYSGFSGGGIYGDAEDACGGGKAGFQNGKPTGGNGGASTCTPKNAYGGFGFGGGGTGLAFIGFMGIINGGGGGGGGYTGGGGGGQGANNQDHFGNGGGGGGSFVNPAWFYLSNKTRYHETKNRRDGYIRFHFTNDAPQKLIRPVAGTSKCIEALEANTFNGNNIQLWDCQEDYLHQQKWVIVGSSIKYTKDLMKCIDLSNGNTDNGANIRVWDCKNGNKNQNWIYDVANQSIRSAVDFNKCIDRTRSNLTNGTNIQLYDCNGTGAQQWFVDGVPSSMPTGSYNRLRLDLHPGKCIDIAQASTANDTNIQVWDCKDSEAQLFSFDGRAIKMQASPNKCIDLRQSGDGNGTNIQLFDCNGTKAQQWIYDGFTKAFRSAVNPAKCLDVDHSNTANGANIQLWDCNSTDAQRFTIQEVAPPFCTNDVTPPVAKCKDVQNTANVIPTAALVDNGSYDDCKISSMKLEATGPQQYKLLVTDPSGNTGSCTAKVY